MHLHSLSEADPGVLANGEVHSDSLECGDARETTSAPPPTGDTPSCEDSVVEDTPTEADRCVAPVHSADGG